LNREKQPEIGLCAECLNCRTIDSARGSRFYLCELGLAEGSGFRKYPQLPVLSCSGFKSDSTQLRLPNNPPSEPRP